MCVKLVCVSLLFTVILFGSYLPNATRGVFAQYGEAVKHEDQPTAMANPAAVYCIEMGYEYKLINEPSGQRGICIFPDGSECEAWAFLQGKCGQSYSYCAQCGYDIETLSDGKNPFSREYAVCVSKEGERIGSVTELTRLSEKAGKVGIRLRSPENKRVGKQLSPDAQPPPSFDWRNHNGHDWMTPVKNQGGCGSCWAFGAVGAVEAMLNIWQNDPYLNLDLSEQYLVSDCCGAGSCDGGQYAPALVFFDTVGIPDEDCFPYIAQNAPCSDRCSDWHDRLIKLDSTKYISSYPYDVDMDLREYISGKGPITVWMGWGGYWDGDIYRCGSTGGRGGHMVVIAGYDDAGGYWIVKNSWGTSWQDSGYFKVGYGECYIEDYVHVMFADELGSGCLIHQNTVLDHDMLNCESRGLTIIADSITVDCNGHIIDGIDSTLHHGIAIGSGITGFRGVTIRNCTITDFAQGIGIHQSNDNRVIGNTLINNFRGILLTAFHDSCTGNNLIDNTIKNSEYIGIDLSYASKNYLSGNFIMNGVGKGVNVQGSQNTFWGNTFADNGTNVWESASNNRWSLADTGNQWSDFESNPGYPDSYVVSGPGDGVDFYASQYVDVVKDEDGEQSLIPGESYLTQNYPNPFNPTTMIEYTVLERTWVRIAVYDILGRKVKTLIDQNQSAGYKSIFWDGRNDSGKEVAGGIYFYRLQAGDFAEVKKMVLLK